MGKRKRQKEHGSKTDLPLMFVRPVMLVRQARGLGRQARGPQAPAAGNPESCAALGYRHRSLSELVDHLLRRMSPLGHLSPFLRPNTNILPGPVFGYRSLKYRISSKSCITFGPSSRVHPLFWGGNSLEGGEYAGVGWNCLQDLERRRADVRPGLCRGSVD